MVRVGLPATLILFSSIGCGLVGPTCVARQQTGAVATLSGEVGPGEIVSLVVPYGTEGSQNDGHIRWSGQSVQDRPRIQVYATRLACREFPAVQPAYADPCAELARAGWFNGNTSYSFIITHGRGNPELLGSPPMYKLWIVGDAQQSATYGIDITWFYGPDC